MKKIWVLTMLLIALLCSVKCNDGGVNNGEIVSVNSKKGVDKVRELTVNLNKYNKEKEEAIIENYIARQGIEALKTDGGYYEEEVVDEMKMEMVTKGKGLRVIKNGDNVNLVGALYQIDGEQVYKYTEEKPLVVNVGNNSDFLILHSALLGKKDGGKYIWIIPSYLGYGRLGDDNNIGANSILVLVAKLKVD